ncbi:hypothetical protein M2138_001072 [Dysgonomonadaceae bacterium PH5-43]|nr:hypothetical protein [Dysgonomonadaceae bacterium PH5-43]
MNKLSYLLCFCVFLLTSCFSVANEIKLNVNNFYNDIHNNSAIATVVFTPGEYVVKMDITNPNDTATVEFAVESLYGDIDYVPVKKLVEVKGVTNISMDFKIEKESTYKIVLKFVEGTGLGAIPYVEVIEGNAKPLEATNSTELRLDYINDNVTGKEYEWIYGELHIPEYSEPIYSGYIMLGYKNAELSFSRYWDSSQFSFVLSDKTKRNTIDIPILKAKGDDVEYGEVSNEEQNKNLTFVTLQSNNPELLAKTDLNLCYLINRRPLPNNQILLSAWFKMKEDKDWTYLATFETNALRSSRDLFSRIYSHEKYKGMTLRRGEFSNIYYKVSDGDWAEINKAKPSILETNGRIDYTAGVTESTPQRFYLATGGFKPMPAVKEELTTNKTNTPPVINTDALSKSIDKAMEVIKPSSWGYYPDDKVAVISGKASDYQNGEGIEKSFDGDTRTIYHSRWSGTKFPVKLTYKFDGKEDIDYIIYYPRTDGSNGNIIEFDLFVKSQGDFAYSEVGSYNFEGSGLASRIDLPTTLKKPESIQFIVKSGIGDSGTNGFVSCAEMEFYKKTGKTIIPDVFTDITCSALKPSITEKDIDNLESESYRNLAKALCNKTYDAEYRVQEYKPYPDPDIYAKEVTRTSPYSLMDNPTGIYVDKNENIVVFVGNTNGQRIALRSLNLDKDYSCSDYSLQEGLNVFKAQDKGLLYIMYHTSEDNAKPVKIHIATGRVNGYYDVAKNPDADWKALLNATVTKYIDVLGKYTHLAFTVDDFKRYTPDVKELIQVWDSIAFMEQQFIGLEKYNKMNPNRMFCAVSNMGYFMFATSNRTGYSQGSLGEICNPQKLRTSAIWGPAHEIGHMNQTIGFKWVGMTEISNNVYSQFIQQQFGNESRLGTEKLNSDFDGVWFNRYEKGFTEMIAGGISQLRHTDVFCKLIPYWQLQLYNADVLGNKDFYADVHEQIRIRPIPKTDGDAVVQFMTICCDVAKLDLTDFFKKWGLLIAVDETLTDHSSIQNAVYSRRGFVMTQNQVDNLIKYAKKYTKPKHNIHYIHDTEKDKSVNIFKEDAKIKKGETKITNNKVEMIGWENVVVFEVYDKGKLVFVTPAHTFTLPEGVTKPEIKAVGAKS